MTNDPLDFRFDLKYFSDRLSRQGASDVAS
jgi:hypothetical protein